MGRLGYGQTNPAESREVWSATTHQEVGKPMTSAKFAEVPSSPHPESVERLLAAEVPGAATTNVWQVIGLGALWIGIGLATAWVLRRRGHEFGPNAALGAILGPLFIFLAYDMSRRRESEEPIELARPGESSGPAVLVIAVGELERAEVAVEAITNAVGDAGPVTAAVPVEYEVGERVHDMEAQPPTSPELDGLAEALSQFSPGLMMLPGRIDKSIARGVQKTGAEWVLLIGSDSSAIAPDLEKDLRTNVLRFGAMTT